MDRDGEDVGVSFFGELDVASPLPPDRPSGPFKGPHDPIRFEIVYSGHLSGSLLPLPALRFRFHLKMAEDGILNHHEGFLHGLPL